MFFSFDPFWDHLTYVCSDNVQYTMETLSSDSLLALSSFQIIDLISDFYILFTIDSCTENIQSWPIRWVSKVVELDGTCLGENQSLLCRYSTGNGWCCQRDTTQALTQQVFKLLKWQKLPNQRYENSHHMMHTLPDDWLWPSHTISETTWPY